MSEQEQQAGAGPVERPVRPLDGAVWIYPLFNYWCLKARNGEILAEILGSGFSDIWSYNGKRYHGLENAKDAAMRSLGAA